jgi:hypothetical protein
LAPLNKVIQEVWRDLGDVAKSVQFLRKNSLAAPYGIFNRLGIEVVAYDARHVDPLAIKEVRSMGCDIVIKDLIWRRGSK